jgi:hypothetical protein
LRIRDWLWQLLGPREEIIVNTEVSDLHRLTRDLAIEIENINEQLAFLATEIDQVRKLNYLAPVAAKSYKFKPTVRSTTGLVQILEARNYDASRLTKEAPKPEDVK